MPDKLLGIKITPLILGFVGAVISLSFVKELRKHQMVVAVVIGTVFAGAITPAVAAQLSLVPETENMTAFLLGLTAMNIVPGLIELSRRFKEDPFSIIDRLRGRRDD